MPGVICGVNSRARALQNKPLRDGYSLAVVPSIQECTDGNRVRAPE